MKFGEKLSLLRKQRGMTQMELADELDISRQAVSRWERGTAEPSTDNLVSIGKLFDVSVDALVDENLQIQEKKTVRVEVTDQEPDSGAGHGCGNRILTLARRAAISAYLLISAAAAVIIIIGFALFCTQKKVAVPMEDGPVRMEDIEREKLDEEVAGEFHLEDGPVRMEDLEREKVDIETIFEFEFHLRD